MTGYDGNFDRQPFPISDGMDFSRKTTATSPKAAILMVRSKRCR